MNIMKNKNLISSLLTVAFCVLFAFSFSSCDFFNFDQIFEDEIQYTDDEDSDLSNDAITPAKPGTMLLVFNPHFTGQNNTINSNSRSAYPDFSDIEALGLTFSIKSSNLTETSGTYDSTNNIISFRIPSRTITTSEEFTIYASKESVKVMVATTSFSYTPGGASTTVNKSINFIPYTTENGNTGSVANGYINLVITTNSPFKITVAFTGSPGITVTGGGTASVTLGNPAGGIAPGVYTAQISIKNTYDVLCDFYIQTIQVWPGLTTNCWYLNDGDTASTINFSVSDTEQKYYVCGSNPTGLYSNSGLPNIETINPSNSNSGDIIHPLQSINSAIAKCTNQNINYKIICDGNFTSAFTVGSDSSYMNCNITICGGGNSNNYSTITTSTSNIIYAIRNIKLENLKLTGNTSGEAISFSSSNSEYGHLKLHNCEISGNKTAVKMSTLHDTDSSWLFISGSTYIPLTSNDENDIQLFGSCKIQILSALDTSQDTGAAPRKIAGFKAMSGNTESGVVGTTQYVYANNGADLATECQRFEYLGYPKVLGTDGKLTYARDFYVSSSTSTPAGSSTGNGSAKHPLDKISSVLPKIKEAANTTGYAGDYTIHISGIIQETSRIEIQSGDYPSSLSLGAFTGSTLKLCGTNNANDKLDGSLLGTGAEILKLSGTNGYPLNLTIENLAIQGNHANSIGINIYSDYTTVKLGNGAFLTKNDYAVSNDGTLIMCGTAQIGTVTETCPTSETGAINNGGNVVGVYSSTSSNLYFGYNSASVDDPDDTFTGGIHGCYNQGIRSWSGNIYMHKGTIGYNNGIGIETNGVLLHLEGGTIIGNNAGAVTFCSQFDYEPLELSGNIYIPAGSEGKNIVRLDTYQNSKIKITDTLNPPAEAGGIVATIVPYSYANTTTVLYDNSSGTLVAANFGKFNIADEVIAGPPASTQGWHLISDGTIKQSPTLDFVTVNSTTSDVFEGGYRIGSSEIFIQNRYLGRMNSLVVSDHEITQGEYEQYCYYGSTGPTVDLGKGRYYPVYNISWYDAIVYCNLKTMNDTSLGSTPAERLSKCAYIINGSKDPEDWPSIGKWTYNGITKYCGSNNYRTEWENVTCDFAAEGWRLPTRVEWQWLALDCNLTNSGQHTYSGTSSTANLPNYAVYNTTKPSEVKTKISNAHQIYDMSGNIAEMCWDWYTQLFNSDIPVTGPAEPDTPNTHWRMSSGGDYTQTSLTRISNYTWGSYDTYNRTFPQNGFRIVRTTEMFRIGNKFAPDSVGDIVFEDGSAMSYSYYQNLDSATKNTKKAQAAAIIFYKGTGLNNNNDTTTSRLIGVGLNTFTTKFYNSDATKAWSENITTIRCDPSAVNLTGTITFNGTYKNRNGKDNYNKIKDYLQTNSTDDTNTYGKYPAYDAAKTYGSTMSYQGALADGWYIPSIAELVAFYQNNEMPAICSEIGLLAFDTSKGYASSTLKEVAIQTFGGMIDVSMPYYYYIKLNDNTIDYTTPDATLEYLIMHQF